MSYYVKRRRVIVNSDTDPRHVDPGIGWTGPIRSPKQAEKERQALENAGWTAEVVPSTPEVRKQIREWERSKRTRLGND
jgi:hypothetical protein